MPGPVAQAACTFTPNSVAGVVSAFTSSGLMGSGERDGEGAGVLAVAC